MHNIKEANYVEQIDFISNPIAYVLYIADNLQEFGRLTDGKENYPCFVLYDIIEDSLEFTLKYILYHEEWTDNLIAEEIKYLENKQQQLEKLKGPRIALMIKATYGSASDEIPGKVLSLGL